MEDAPYRGIDVASNGPLRVEGGIPLSRQTIETNAQGEAWEWRETGRIDAGPSYELCRCARIVRGPGLDLADAVAFCAGARFCQARGSAWELILREDSGGRRLVEREAGNCPSGRLVALRHGSDGTSTAVEPELEPSIVLVEDARRGLSGPVWVRGGVDVRSAEGHPYEVRNRVTLCRCGESAN